MTRSADGDREKPKTPKQAETPKPAETPTPAERQRQVALHYLRGTKIGDDPSDEVFERFIGAVIDGIGAPPPSRYEKVSYNAGFRPLSHGGMTDLTYDASLAQGVQLLAERAAEPGEVIFGYSQGAVVASFYKSAHTGNRYVLVENPSRPNGGIMARFPKVSIPVAGVTFSGATPHNGDHTVDVARQYDGWADFPADLWNPLAVANALMGILVVHGGAQTEVTADEIRAAESAGRRYYQYDADSNTVYYLLRTPSLPLLMPFERVLPRRVVDAVAGPLRWVIETAYDRSDYSRPTRSTFLRPLGLLRRMVQDTGLV